MKRRGEEEDDEELLLLVMPSLGAGVLLLLPWVNKKISRNNLKIMLGGNLEYINLLNERAKKE